MSQFFQTNNSETISNRSCGSTSIRLNLLVVAPTTIKKTWLFGEGTYGTTAPPVYRKDIQEKTGMIMLSGGYAHNQFIDTVLQNGIFALLLLIALFLLPLIHSVKHQQKISTTLILLFLAMFMLDSFLLLPYGVRIFTIFWLILLPQVIEDKQDKAFSLSEVEF